MEISYKIGYEILIQILIKISLDPIGDIAIAGLRLAGDPVLKKSFSGHLQRAHLIISFLMSLSGRNSSLLDAVCRVDICINWDHPRS